MNQKWFIALRALWIISAFLFPAFSSSIFNALFAGGLINPEIQRIYCQRNFIQFFADKCKIFYLIIADPAVTGYLDQACSKRIDFIQTGNGFQDYIG